MRNYFRTLRGLFPELTLVAGLMAAIFGVAALVGHIVANDPAEVHIIFWVPVIVFVGGHTVMVIGATFVYLGMSLFEAFVKKREAREAIRKNEIRKVIQRKMMEDFNAKAAKPYTPCQPVPSDDV